MIAKISSSSSIAFKKAFKFKVLSSFIKLIFFKFSSIISFVIFDSSDQLVLNLEEIPLNENRLSSVGTSTLFKSNLSLIYFKINFFLKKPILSSSYLSTLKKFSLNPILSSTPILFKYSLSLIKCFLVPLSISVFSNSFISLFSFISLMGVSSIILRLVSCGSTHCK